MQKPFVVDVFMTDSKNNLTKKRIGADSEDSALKTMGEYSDLPGVTRIVISRRQDGCRNVSKMKVWTRPMVS